MQKESERPRFGYYKALIDALHRTGRVKGTKVRLRAWVWPGWTLNESIKLHEEAAFLIHMELSIENLDDSDRDTSPDKEGFYVCQAVVDHNKNP